MAGNNGKQAEGPLTLVPLPRNKVSFVLFVAFVSFMAHIGLAKGDQP